MSTLKISVVAAGVVAASLGLAAPAGAAGGSPGAPNYAPTTSAATTVGQESNSLTVYTDPSRPAQVSTYASVRFNDVATGDLPGRMSLEVCDIDGACSPGPSTGFAARYNPQDGRTTPANWFPGVRTASGRPLRSVRLHVVLDTGYPVDGQPQDVLNTLP